MSQAFVSSVVDAPAEKVRATIRRAASHLKFLLHLANVLFARKLNPFGNCVF
jgi:hypothetical protein